MKWQRNQKDTKTNQQYYVNCGDYTICKVYLKDGWKYELWKGKEQGKLFDSFDDAKEAVILNNRE